MGIFLTRSFRFSVIAIMLLACKTSRYIVAESDQPDCVRQLMPQVIETAWYNASIDVVGRHLSGLLLFKRLQDGEQRVVFTNEAGITFFDFGFKNREFLVHSIIRQLRKRPVINTLRKDFSLILGIPFTNASLERFESQDEVYYAAPEKKELAYFITTKDCASLRRLEWGTAKKATVSVEFPGAHYPTPDKILVNHHTFDLQITLTRIPKP